ncbi:MAG: RNA polymerase sigma factor [Anaerolineae bacterium]
MEISLSAQQGERHLTAAAFGELYEATFDRIYSFVRYQVADDALADDITAQVYERVLHGYARFDPQRGSLINWLFGIARNVVREHRRQQRRQPTLPLDALRERAHESRRPEQIVAERERSDRLLHAVAGLKPREREILALKFGAGMTNRQIAAVLDLSESNVGTIVYRALGRLRDELGVDDV